MAEAQHLVTHSLICNRQEGHECWRTTPTWSCRSGVRLLQHGRVPTWSRCKLPRGVGPSALTLSATGPLASASSALTPHHRRLSLWRRTLRYWLLGFSPWRRPMQHWLLSAGPSTTPLSTSALRRRHCWPPALWHQPCRHWPLSVGACASASRTSASRCRPFGVGLISLGFLVLDLWCQHWERQPSWRWPFGVGLISLGLSAPALWCWVWQQLPGDGPSALALASSAPWLRSSASALAPLASQRRPFGIGLFGLGPSASALWHQHWRHRPLSFVPLAFVLLVPAMVTPALRRRPWLRWSLDVGRWPLIVDPLASALRCLSWCPRCALTATTSTAGDDDNDDEPPRPSGGPHVLGRFHGRRRLLLVRLSIKVDASISVCWRLMSLTSDV